MRRRNIGHEEDMLLHEDQLFNRCVLCAPGSRGNVCWQTSEEVKIHIDTCHK